MYTAAWYVEHCVRQTTTADIGHTNLPRQIVPESDRSALNVLRAALAFAVSRPRPLPNVNSDCSTFRKHRDILPPRARKRVITPLPRGMLRGVGATNSLLQCCALRFAHQSPLLAGLLGSTREGVIGGAGRTLANALHANTCNNPDNCQG